MSVCLPACRRCGLILCVRVGCRHVGCCVRGIDFAQTLQQARRKNTTECLLLLVKGSGKMLLGFQCNRSGIVSRLAQCCLVVLAAQSLVERSVVHAHVPVSVGGEASALDRIATSRSEGPGSLQERRELRISTELCETVCATSQRLVGTVNLTGKLRTRKCFGEDRMESCCICLEQGFKPKTSSDSNRTNSGGSPKPAFVHICIPTTPRILDGKDIDFLHIMLRSLEEQVLAQATSGQGFAGVGHDCAWVSIGKLWVKTTVGQCAFSLETQLLALPVEWKVNLMVYNTRPGQHPVFEQNRDIFEGHDFISFKEIQKEWKDPTNFEPDNMNNPKDIPGGEVRHQVRAFLHDVDSFRK